MTADHALDKGRRAENWADIVDDLLRENFYARVRRAPQRKPLDAGSDASREHSRQIAAILPRSVRI